MTTANVVWLPLGELLIERGLLSRAQLELALAQQRRAGFRLGEVLVAMGFVSGEALARMLLEQVGLAAPAPSAPAELGGSRVSGPEPVVPEPALAAARPPLSDPQPGVGAFVVPATDAAPDGSVWSSRDKSEVRVRELEELLSDFDERSRAVEEEISRLRATLLRLREKLPV